MTPNLKGIAASLSEIRHNIETQAADVLSQANDINTQASSEIARAKKNLADTKAAVDELKQFNASLEGSNGGPTLSGSQGSSGAQPQGETQQPQGSWNGQQKAT